MPPKADTPAPPIQPAETGVSGKFLIIGIFLLAFAGAGGSWLFRYNATHRSARFWGPEAARLIRDAPQVKLYRDPLVIARKIRDAARSGAEKSDVDAALAGMNQKIADSAIDVSNAHGLAHLRNALLEDRNFVWPVKDLTLLDIKNIEAPYWYLVFQDPTTGKFTKIYFSEDCRQGMRTSNPQGPVGNQDGKLISTEPIAAGLAEMFAEFSAAKPADPAAPDSAADPAR